MYQAKVFEISSTHSYTPLVKYAKKHLFLKTFALCYRNGSFECFGGL